MIKVIELTKIEQITELLHEQDYDEKTDRYTNRYLYRGLPDASFKLVSSIKRVCKHEQANLESVILKRFSNYSQMELTIPSNNIWSQMIIGQHHGLPTRLLDWTKSPLIGLHFAMTEKNLEKMNMRDCCLWKIRLSDINSLLPEKYKSRLCDDRYRTFTLDSLNKLAPDPAIYDKDMGDSAMLIMEPPSLDARIISQNSFFSVIPMYMDSIEDFLDKYTENTVKYIISKDIRWRVRDMLDQLMFNERMIFPGLDGLSQWLERHYYVK